MNHTGAITFPFAFGKPHFPAFLPATGRTVPILSTLTTVATYPPQASNDKNIHLITIRITNS